jgi:hypothetical protein
MFGDMNEGLDKISTLERLKGHELSAVTFVRDYLQLQFDGPFLNIFVWPRIMAPGASVSLEMPGYRDGLCAQIGKTVGGVAVETDVNFRLFFTDGSMIEVSLLPNARRGRRPLYFRMAPVNLGSGSAAN